MSWDTWRPNSADENDAEKAAKPYRKRLKDAQLVRAHRIHGNGYDSRGDGIFLDDESRRWLAAQDLRRCAVDVPVSASLIGKNGHSASDRIVSVMAW
jgi:hypothetical protein